MSSFKEFMREKGFYFALLGCILAAALTSVWAIRTMVSRISIKDPSLLPQQHSVREPAELQPAPEPAAEASGVPALGYGWPVQGSVSQSMSGDELVYNKTLKDWRTHNGTDIACRQGAAVTASTGGKVTGLKNSGTFGTVVEITDGEGRVWRYCGLSAEPAVGMDDAVSAGQALGTVGTVESEQGDGAHLHLEIKQGKTYLDPEKLIG